MATNSILNDLFAQILHSEEKVKERFAKLKQVNEEIENFQAKTSETKEEIESLQGNLVIKRQKVAEQELQLKWFSEKQKIFTEQKVLLEKKKLDSENRLKNLQQDSTNEREKFVEESEQFSSMYDLISDGRKKREIVRKKNLEELIELEENLKREIGQIKKQKSEINLLDGKKEKLLWQINDLEAKQKRIDNLIKEKKEETERLLIEKNNVAQKPQNDPEFQSILTELQKCKENSLSLEGICDAMGQELRELRQQYYQKQLQKQRKQRQQQQQEHKRQKQLMQNQQHQFRQKKLQQQQIQLQQIQLQRQQLPHQHQDLIPLEMAKNQEIHRQYRAAQATKIQRPLFGDSQVTSRRQGENNATDEEASHSTASRFQKFAKKPHFYY